jgi:hypothetical protein
VAKSSAISLAKVNNTFTETVVVRLLVWLLIYKEEKPLKIIVIILVNQDIISTGMEVVKSNVMLLSFVQLLMASIIVFILVKILNIFIKTAPASPLATALTPRDMKALKITVMLLVIKVSTCISTEAVLQHVTFLSRKEVREAEFSVIILVLVLLISSGMALAQTVTPLLSNKSSKIEHTVSILVLTTNTCIGMDLVLTTVPLLWKITLKVAKTSAIILVQALSTFIQMEPAQLNVSSPSLVMSLLIIITAEILLKPPQFALQDSPSLLMTHAEFVLHHMLTRLMETKHSVFLLAPLDNISIGPMSVLILVIYLTRSETKMSTKKEMNLISNTVISLVLIKSTSILMVFAPKIVSTLTSAELKLINNIATNLVKMVLIFTGMEVALLIVTFLINMALMEVSKLAVILAHQMNTSTSMDLAKQLVSILLPEDSKVTETIATNHALPTHIISIITHAVQIVILLSSLITLPRDGLVTSHVTPPQNCTGIILVLIALFLSCLLNPMIFNTVIILARLDHTFTGTPLVFQSALILLLRALSKENSSVIRHALSINSFIGISHVHQSAILPISQEMKHNSNSVISLVTLLLSQSCIGMVPAVNLVPTLSLVEWTLSTNLSVNTLAMTACSCTSTKLALDPALFLINNQHHLQLVKSATTLVPAHNSSLGMVLVLPLVTSLMFKSLFKANCTATSHARILNTLIGMVHARQHVLLL